MREESLQIGVVGAGALAHAMARRWMAAGHRVRQVWARRADAAQQLAVQLEAEFLMRPSAFDPTLDVVLLAVSDDALAEVAAQLAPHRGPATLYAHASGGAEAAVLGALAPHVAVIWPVQTFTRGRVAQWAGVPIVTECAGLPPAQQRALERAARSLSDHHLALSGAERLRLHLAATLVANFTNALVAEAEALLHPQGHSHQLLLPLLSETTAKLAELSPGQAQTGPARRGDQGVMARHRALIASLAEGEQARALGEIYTLISARIAARAAGA